MTRVDFYISADKQAQARELLACRVIDKAHQQQSPIYIHTDSSEQMNKFDKLLWTFREQSFIPHSCVSTEQSQYCNIIVGHEEPPENQNQVLVNLANDVPMFFSRFDRVIEIVHEDDAAKQYGRERYKFYKDRGYALSTHNINN